MGKRRGKWKGNGKQRDRKEQSRSEEIVIYGVHPVEEYLEVAGDRVERLLVANTRGDLGRIEELASAAGVTLEQAPGEALDEWSDGRNHQGVVLLGAPYAYVEVEDLLEGIEDRDEAMILILDQVQDAGNLGAILRSAAAYGVDGVILPKDRAASVTGAVVKASAGQALRVKIARETNLVRAMERLKEDRFWTVGMFVKPGERAQAPWEIEMKGTRVALVLGGEHGGVRRLVGENCDFSAYIPMMPGVESLNVSAAASVLMYEVRRQWSV